MRRTRAFRAVDLHRLLKRGPSFLDPAPFENGPLTVEEAAAQFRRWSKSWILDDLVDLIPELRTRKKAGLL